MILLRAEGIRKVFLTEAGPLEVLKGIDLEIQEGEMVAVVGASGAGKSTLLHILGTIDRPTSGRVTFLGRDVFSLDDRALAEFRNRSVGFVFQFHHLLPEFTALENVMMPALISGIPWQEAADRATRLLVAVGLKDRLSHRPGELSGGEQQRVAVARALVMEPPLVLADEPTGNLDTSTGMELLGLLQRFNRESGTTFLIVTHNPEISRACQRVFTMRDGMLSTG